MYNWDGLHFCHWIQRKRHGSVLIPDFLTIQGSMNVPANSSLWTREPVLVGRWLSKHLLGPVTVDLCFSIHLHGPVTVGIWLSRHLHGPVMEWSGSANIYKVLSWWTFGPADICMVLLCLAHGRVLHDPACAFLCQAEVMLMKGGIFQRKKIFWNITISLRKCGQ